MSAGVFGGIPLTLMMAVTLLQCGAAAGWWPEVMPQASLLGAGCAWAGGCWLLWQIDTARPCAAAPMQRQGTVAAAVTPPPVERRSTPRFAISCPVELDLHERGRRRGELQDISQGGARIRGVGALETGSYGLLLVAGITLPVPFHVAGDTQAGDVRVQFELSGMTLHSFILHLEQLAAAGSSAALTAS